MIINKGHLPIIIALASIIGSVIVSSQISNFFAQSVHSGHIQEASALSLPLRVDHYFPIKEKAGDAKDGETYVKIDENFIDPDQHCEFCLRIEYVPGPQHEAGIAFDAKDLHLDLPNAKKVRFFAMGEDGGEKVKFKAVGKDAKAAQVLDGKAKKSPDVAGLPSPQSVPDKLFKERKFAVTTDEVTLTDDWKPYEIDLSNADPTNMASLFAMELLEGKGAKEHVYYIKNIIFDSKPAVASDLATVLPQEEGVGEPLTVQLTANSTGNITAPATIEFGANVSNGTEPYAYDWAIGGEKEQGSETLQHTFDEPGNYNVTVAVGDSQNNTGSASMEVQINEPAEAEINANAVNNNNNSSSTSSEIDAASSFNNDNNTPPSIANSTNNNDTVTNDEDKSEITSDDKGGNNSTDASTQQSDEKDSESIKTLEAGGEEKKNAAPIAKTLGEVVAHPGDDVVLDGSQSMDPDGDKITYQWSQSKGENVDITGQDSATPTVSIPQSMQAKDGKIIIDLVVSDGSLESKKQSTTMSIQDTIESGGNNVHEGKSVPKEEKDSEWEAKGCNGDDKTVAECLGDDSDNTGVASQGLGDTDLFSFKGYDLDDNAKIQDVTAQILAKSEDGPGFVSFVADSGKNNEHYTTESIPIKAGSSIDKYSYTWKKDPGTGEGWTKDSLGSFVAGYNHTYGQSKVEISEFNLIVTYTEPNDKDGEKNAHKSNDSSSVTDKDGGGSSNSDSSNSGQLQSDDGNNEEQKTDGDKESNDTAKSNILETNATTTNPEDNKNSTANKYDK